MAYMESKMQGEAAPAKTPVSALYRERITQVRHYTDKLFSFKTTRDPAFRFTSGQFAMIGIEVDGRPLLRAYSMTSAHYDDWLEFFSIKVPNGPLTSRLQHVKPGDTLLVNKKPTGTLLQSNLIPGKRLVLLSTGTGIAPFASIIKDPDVYERFESVVLVHGCRQVAELAFGTETVTALRQSELMGEYVQGRLFYYATVTREPYYHQGRVTDLIDNGKLFADLAMPPLDLQSDRVMLCGNPEMLKDSRSLLTARGFTEGSSGAPGHFVIEKAFVER